VQYNYLCLKKKIEEKKLTCAITGENSSLPDNQMQDGVSLIGLSHEIIQ